MTENEFNQRVQRLFESQEGLLNRRNIRQEEGNGVFQRFAYPILTAAHVNSAPNDGGKPWVIYSMSV